MAANYVITPTAERDVTDIADYYESQRPGTTVPWGSANGPTPWFAAAIPAHDVAPPIPSTCAVCRGTTSWASEKNTANPPIDPAATRKNTAIFAPTPGTWVPAIASRH